VKQVVVVDVPPSAAVALKEKQLLDSAASIRRQKQHGPSGGAQPRIEASLTSD